jgi:hypothetical protein
VTRLRDMPLRTQPMVQFAFLSIFTTVVSANPLTTPHAQRMHVLKLVNSTFFGARQTVTTAERAVAYLGLDTLGAVVLAQGSTA